MYAAVNRVSVAVNESQRACVLDANNQNVVGVEFDYVFAQNLLANSDISRWFGPLGAGVVHVVNMSINPGRLASMRRPPRRGWQPFRFIDTSTVAT